jgi:hypothetical protein
MYSLVFGINLVLILGVSICLFVLFFQESKVFALIVLDFILLILHRIASPTDSRTHYLLHFSLALRVVVLIILSAKRRLVLLN